MKSFIIKQKNNVTVIQFVDMVIDKLLITNFMDLMYVLRRMNN